MSTFKTKIDGEAVSDFLKQRYDSAVTDFIKITGGELSQAFSYTNDGASYVIRINGDDHGFKKDLYAYEHFISPRIPIPKTIDLGTFNDSFFYSITEKVPGKILDECSESEQLVNSVLTTLDAIHDTPISGNKYGHWDETGIGSHDTWKAHLLELLIYNQKDLDSNNCADWLEQSVVDELTEKFVALVEYCPEVRHLLHADFESSNTLSDGVKITGVIDWANAKYGDPVFDIAWIDFWKENIDYKRAFKQHQENIGRDIENYEERVRCYMLYFGIGCLFFFAKSQQRNSYEWTKKRLLKMLKED